MPGCDDVFAEAQLFVQNGRFEEAEELLNGALASELTFVSKRFSQISGMFLLLAHCQEVQGKPGDAMRALASIIRARV